MGTEREAGDGVGGHAVVDAEAVVHRLLFDPEAREDPYPLYRRLREVEPAYEGPMGLVLSRYGDCVRMLRDQRLGKGFDPDHEARQVVSMLDLDPPEHTRQRRLVSRVFTPARVEALRPWVEGVVAGLVETMAEAREVDVMEVLAFPLPVTVIGELLGVPEADRAGFQPLVRDAAGTLELVVDEESAARARAAQATMADYFGDLLDERRARPRDDLLSALARAGERDEALSEDEVVATASLLFGAGFETTTSLIGNGLLALLRHPDQMARLGGDPPAALVASAVEELLRWDSPVQLDGRVATEDVEVAGRQVPRGRFVLALLGGANRDPSRFRDPERLDLGRPDAGPISFGAGIHHCLGAGLARLEGQAVLGAVARRFACVELLADPPERRPGLTLRGLAHLPVRVTGR